MNLFGKTEKERIGQDAGRPARIDLSGYFDIIHSL
jgi:hypothetical protein